MATKTIEKNGGGASNILPEEVIRHVPITDVFVDYDWNVRSKAQVFSEVSDGVQDTEATGSHLSLSQGTGFHGLCLDIHMTGQDDPVILRRVENGKSLGGKKTACPLELVCGFRRISAVASLNDPAFRVKMTEGKEAKEVMARRTGDGKPVVPNTADGTVKAVIRVLNPAEALILNAKENTLRANLTTPDMVNYLSKQLKGGRMTQSALAAALGVGQPYVSRLARITNLPSLITEHWRGDDVTVPGLPKAITKRLTSREMTDLADVSKDDTNPGETIARYVAILHPQGAADGGETTPADPVAKRITELFETCGRLCKLGILEPASMIPATLASVIGPKKDGFLIDCGKADAAKRTTYWELAVDSFYKGLGEPRPKGRKARTAEPVESEAEGNSAAS